MSLQLSPAQDLGASRSLSGCHRSSNSGAHPRLGPQAPAHSDLRLQVGLTIQVYCSSVAGWSHEGPSFCSCPAPGALYTLCYLPLWSLLLTRVEIACWTWVQQFPQQMPSCLQDAPLALAVC